MVGAAFDVLWPVANVLVRVEDKVGRTRHVVFPLSFTHVVHGAVSLIRMVGNVAVFFFTSHFVSCN